MSSAPAEQRRSQQREQARRTILDATEAILVEDGFESLSIRRLASRCGYTAPSIYHHFGDKTGLVAALLDERFQRLYEELRRVERGDDPAADLRATALAFVDFATRHPNHYALLASTELEEDAEPESARRARALLEVPLMTLESSGRLAAPDVETAAQMIWAACHGVISLRIQRPHHDFAPDLAERVLDALLASLVASGGGNEPDEGSDR
ncbi:MAG: TetR/AcrR family transcriptional regulator [Myxococcota bacterium]